MKPHSGLSPVGWYCAKAVWAILSKDGDINDKSICDLIEQGYFFNAIYLINQKGNEKLKTALSNFSYSVIDEELDIVKSECQSFKD